MVIDIPWKIWVLKTLWLDKANAWSDFSELENCTLHSQMYFQIQHRRRWSKESDLVQTLQIYKGGEAGSGYKECENICQVLLNKWFRSTHDI